MQEEDILIRQIHTEAATFLRQQKPDEDIIHYIVSRGYERHYAETVLDNVKEDVADKAGFRKTLLYGMGLLAAGILLNVASYRFSLKAGTMEYILFWGLVVGGITFIARAFIIFKK